MGEPIVSVVITTCNRPQLLQRAVASVIEQSYGNFELLIVDDASDREVITDVQPLLSEDTKLRYLRQDARKGLAAARNRGIVESIGEYIAFLDDDDEWKPECLELRVKAFEDYPKEISARLGVVYCGEEILIVDEDRSVLNMPKLEGNIKTAIIDHDLATIPSSCLFTRKALKSCGGFDESLASSIDHDIWMSLAENGYDACAVKMPLVITRQFANRTSMVTDTRPRVEGVEQYLAKWSPILISWFGANGGKEYIKKYRSRVLGNLASTKLLQGKLHESYLLYRHVLIQNRFSIRTQKILMTQLARILAKTLIPKRIRKHFFRKTAAEIR